MERASRSRRSPITTARVLALRKNGNLAEAILWEMLRARRLAGYKFVRQFPVGPYFADFLCRSRKLVIESDGSQHVNSGHDQSRDNYMLENGFAVLRLWSGTILRDKFVIGDTIIAALEGRMPATEASDVRFLVPPGWIS